MLANRELRRSDRKNPPFANGPKDGAPSSTWRLDVTGREKQISGQKTPEMTSGDAYWARYRGTPFEVRVNPQPLGVAALE
jgi:hypothetical protein